MLPLSTVVTVSSHSHSVSQITVTMTAGGSDDGGVSKRQRIGGSNSRISDSSPPDINLTELPHKSSTAPRPSSGGFNDAATADVILRLHFDHHHHQSSPSDSAVEPSELQIYLHSRVLHRSKYFAALLSDRWQQQGNDESENSAKIHRFNLAVPVTAGSFDHYLTVLEMLYSNYLLPQYDSVATALNILPIALELLFEECICSLVAFLEGVPWSEDEENKILELIPLLNRDKEGKGLVARVSRPGRDSPLLMLIRLIESATPNNTKTAPAKAFVTKLLRDFASRETVGLALYKVFESTLEFVEEYMKVYSSPDIELGGRNDPEIVQKLSLQKAMTHGKELLWLVERMVELNVADRAAMLWGLQVSLAANLQKAFRNDVWKNTVPSLAAVVLRCTSRLAGCFASGNFCAAIEFRLGIVKAWLPVLILCKDSISPIGPNPKSLYRGLEETFLKIISTLPMSDAQDLLQQCLSFATINVEDCPHLAAAFTTWFRRAERDPLPDPSQ